MLSADQAPVDPLYALAAAIAQRRTPGIQRAFSQPGQGVVPLPGQDGNAMGSGMTPPDPGQLAVPDAFNPGFPQAASAPDAAPVPDPARFMATSSRPQPSVFPGKVADDTLGASPPVVGTPTVQLPYQDRPGLIGRMLPPGLRNGIVDAMAALGNSDPSAPALTTLGQAFSGAQSSKQAREDRKLALTTAADDKAYERGRDTRQDTRADRSLTLQERKAASDERKSVLDEISTAAGIEHTQAETNKIEREYAKNDLTTDQMLKVEDKVLEYGKSLNASGSLYPGQAPSDETVNRNKKLTNDYRTQLIQSLTSGTDTGGSSEVPRTSTGSGDGTWDAPIIGANPHSLSPGHIFIAPPGSTYEGKDVSGQRFERQ